MHAADAIFPIHATTESSIHQKAVADGGVRLLNIPWHWYQQTDSFIHHALSNQVDTEKSLLQARALV